MLSLASLPLLSSSMTVTLIIFFLPLSPSLFSLLLHGCLSLPPRPLSPMAPLCISDQRRHLSQICRISDDLDRVFRKHGCNRC
ncbi:hypothetical protein CsSME_00027049 [Camellia sinensis var. sinensis]